MRFKELIKQNKTIRKTGKTLKIYKEFLSDAHGFSSSYVEAAEEKENYKYSILLLVHSLEKGMCMPTPRPFGGEKIRKLISHVKNYHGDTNDFEYKIAVNMLFSWKRFYETQGWENEKVYLENKAFLDSYTEPKIVVGSKEYDAENFSSEELKGFEHVILTRHSVRNFEKKELKKSDINFAIKCFQEAPTACNRQMCKIILVKSEEVKHLLDETIIGISGFNKDAVNYFIVTYDLAAFAYSGERQQGLFNAGLCAMNFINALHTRRIGSCCLQWSNKHTEDLKVRKALKLQDSERIAVVIAAGYYLEKNVIPCSARKELKDIYKEI